MRLQFKEKRGELRKVRDYCEDVALGLQLSGVVENSVWNSLLSFHVYENYAADILHDLFEGVCKTDMSIILQYYICEKRSFSVASLNARINSFNYNLNGLGNKPPSFTYEDIQDGKLNMSATEMFNFTLLFSFFVGDMFEPDRQDPVWLLYLTLREIIDIAVSKSLQIECIEQFKDLVEQHHRIRVVKLKSPLKPKDHFLVHYSLIMEMSGPVAHLSTGKFESKHKVLKMNAKSTSSRVNITHTLCMKEQLSFCYRIACKRGLEHKLEMGPEEYYSTPEGIDNFFLFSRSLPYSFLGSCMTVPWVKCKGITYRQNSVLVVDHDSDSFPVFGSIETILLNEKSEICFVCKIFTTRCMDENLNAFVVSETSILQCYQRNDLLCPFLAIYHVSSSGQGYVAIKGCT